MGLYTLMNGQKLSLALTSSARATLHLMQLSGMEHTSENFRGFAGALYSGTLQRSNIQYYFQKQKHLISTM